MGQTDIKKRKKEDYRNGRRQKVIEKKAYRRDHLKFQENPKSTT